MSDFHRQMLSIKYGELLRNISTTELIPHLLQNKVSVTSSYETYSTDILLMAIDFGSFVCFYAPNGISLIIFCIMNPHDSAMYVLTLL